VTTSNPRLIALATAVPPYALGQAEVAARPRHLFAETASVDLDRMMPVFANAGIERRYSCVPIDWYDRPHGWVERNALYLDHALELLERATRNALAQARLQPRDIGAIVAVSTTGIATPSLDALLMDRLGFDPRTRRLPILGLGCAGGVIGLSRAAMLARAAPDSRVLLLVVELCALTFRKRDTSKSNLVATALFGDGAAAAILACDGTGAALTGSGEHTWPGSLAVMGWEVAEDGLKALFSRDIPTIVRDRMRDAAMEFLAREGLTLPDIQEFVCHPGGAKVLPALEEAFGLAAETLADERAVLRDFGNMSAATVLFVLERRLGRFVRGRLLMTALGPGFTAGFQLLEAP